MSTSYLRRASVALAVTAILVVAGTADTPRAQAGLHSSSEAVATEAGQALDALTLWRETHRPIHYVRYLRARAHTAGLIAAEFGVSPDRLAGDWGDADEHKQVALLSALTQLGVPYHSMWSKPGVGFDCSGLTTWAFAEAGIELPRISGEQIRAAENVPAEEAEPGDLAWYPGHVSIYLGENLLVHSPNSGNVVEVIEVPSRTSRYGDAVSALAPADAVAGAPAVPEDRAADATASADITPGSLDG